MSKVTQLSDTNITKLKTFVWNRYKLELLVEEIYLIFDDYGIETFFQYDKSRDQELLSALDSRFYFSITGEILEKELTLENIACLDEKVKEIGFITKESLFA